MFSLSLLNFTAFPLPFYLVSRYKNVENRIDYGRFGVKSSSAEIFQ